MQIEIDFEVYKALTLRRLSESDSYNSVLRRVLDLPSQSAVMAAARGEPYGETARKIERIARGELPHSKLAAAAQGIDLEAPRNTSPPLGAWFDNIFFPEQTRFRATYKGQTFEAVITGGCWIGGDGIIRTSPSAAAKAISNTNVNGWRFWHALLPDKAKWRRLDEVRQ